MDIEWGYFNVKVEISENEVPMFNLLYEKSNCNYNVLNVNHSKVLQEVREVINIDIIASHYGKYFPSFNFADCFEKNLQLFKIYLQMLDKGLAFALKSKVVKHYTVHFPFIRFALGSPDFLFTYFNTVEYLDGSKELWIIEQIQTEPSRSDSGFGETICRALYETRNSAFTENSCMRYQSISEEYRLNTISVNYILENYIALNYNLTKAAITDVVILGNGKLYEFNNKKKKKSRTIYFSDNDSWTLIGIDKQPAYEEYLKNGLEKMIFYSILASNMQKFKDLICRRSPKSTLELEREEIYATYLQEALAVDKVLISEDVKQVIKRKSHYKYERIFEKIIYLCGVYQQAKDNFSI